MRKFHINAATVSPGRYQKDVDNEFMEEVSSIITLEDGTSLNLRNAVVLYNPDSRKIQITDSETIPSGYEQLATLRLTDEPVADDFMNETGPPTDSDVPDDSLADEPEDTPDVGSEPDVDEDEGSFFQ